MYACVGAQTFLTFWSKSILVMVNCMVINLIKILGTFVIYYTHSSLRCLELENKPVFSLVSFSLASNKINTIDKVDGKYIVWAIYLHIPGGGIWKLKFRKQFLLHNMQNNCTKTSCKKTCNTLPPP